jgi:poly(3-hydroxybutyrate) depolymerase
MLMLFYLHYANSQTYTSTAKTFQTISPSCNGYWEMLPPGYNASDLTKKYPLIIQLHGAGEVGEGTGSMEDLMRLVSLPFFARTLATRVYLNEFPTSFTVGGQQYSFLVMAIHCDFFFGLTDVEAYLNYFVNNYNVDLDRIFLTGYSVGGSRTWEAGGTRIDLMDRFAAIVPISGGADGSYFCCPQRCCPVNPTACSTGCNGENFLRVVNNLGNTRNKPRVLAIHGKYDPNLSPVVGKDYVDGIKNVNPNTNARLFIYDETNNPVLNGDNAHEVWRWAYDPSRNDFDGSNLYVWMLSQAQALLPVTLTRFKARAAGPVVELNWSTATETNSSHFSIERSSDGRAFREIGRVNSNGNSSIQRNYSFTDNSPLPGNNYYRLKMVDKDATFDYSNIERVSMNGSNLEFSFSPNPVVNEALVQVRGKYKGQLKLIVTDLMGRTVRNFSYSMNTELFSQKISLADLPAGQYFINLRGDNLNFNQRIMKQ